METTVKEADDRDFYLTGKKTWVSTVLDSEAAVVWAKLPEGLGTVIVEFDQPGVEIQQHFTNMFGHERSQFYMEDVHVPKEGARSGTGGSQRAAKDVKLGVV